MSVSSFGRGAAFRSHTTWNSVLFQSDSTRHHFRIRWFSQQWGLEHREKVNCRGHFSDQTLQSELSIAVYGLRQAEWVQLRASMEMYKHRITVEYAYDKDVNLEIADETSGLRHKIKCETDGDQRTVTEITGQRHHLNRTHWLSLNLLRFSPVKSSQSCIGLTPCDMCHVCQLTQSFSGNVIRNIHTFCLDGISPHQYFPRAVQGGVPPKLELVLESRPLVVQVSPTRWVF